MDRWKLLQEEWSHGQFTSKNYYIIVTYWEMESWMGADSKVQSCHQCLHRDEPSLFCRPSIFISENSLCAESDGACLVTSASRSLSKKIQSLRPASTTKWNANKTTTKAIKVLLFSQAIVFLFSLSVVLRFNLEAFFLLDRCSVMSHVLSLYFSLRQEFLCSIGWPQIYNPSASWMLDYRCVQYHCVLSQGIRNNSPKPPLNTSVFLTSAWDLS